MASRKEDDIGILGFLKKEVLDRTLPRTFFGLTTRRTNYGMTVDAHMGKTTYNISARSPNGRHHF
jgi:hypothetical protein